MIPKEDFVKIVETLKKVNKRSLDLYQNYNIDLIEFETDYLSLFDEVLKNVFNETQIDWFDWFCYENDFGEKGLEALDENKNLICQDIDSLYETLKSYERIPK